LLPKDQKPSPEFALHGHPVTKTTKSKGGEVYVPKDAVKRVAEQSIEARIEERV
jgi:hypothetical protein